MEKEKDSSSSRRRRRYPQQHQKMIVTEMRTARRGCEDKDEDKYTAASN